MERRISRLTLYAGLLLIALGLIVLYIGYNGAATHANVAQQVPYLMSGGFTAVVLVVLGAAALISSVLLSVQAGTREALGIVDESVREMTEVLSRREFSTQGSDDGSEIVSVSRGSSSYHRADCRLVAGKPTVKAIPRDEADRQGLLACRVCKP